MDIADTRKCNLMNFTAVARYLDAQVDDIVSFYEEICADTEFLEAVNQRIEDSRSKGFNKGIFQKGTVASVDWFAFERVLIYVLIRHLKPQTVLETGVYYGGNSAFALRALDRNKSGTMVSIDFPDSQIRKDGTEIARHALVGDTELYDNAMRPGFMVPSALHSRWQLIEGDSLKVIPDLPGTFDFYLHDSDHSMKFLSMELAAAWQKLSKNAFILVDDIDWSNAFFAFCVQHRLYPLLLTDNGKDDLRVRTGVAMRAHPRNGDPSFT